MLIAWYTQHLILSFVNLEKKINERKEFCDAETLNQKNENMNFTRFSRMLFVLKKKYDC